MIAAIRSMPELIQALRARVAELELTHETLDGVAGFQSGYTSKLLAPIPIKNLGPMSFEAILGALGVAVVVVPDPEQIKRVESRWTKRERPRRGLASAFMLKPHEVPIEPQQMTRQDKLKMWGQMGGKASSKRRMKTMKKRQRQRIAQHAARARWGKAKLRA